ncbi:MAG: DsbA family protein [Alphaproteobacteria bacterium]|nr:DsbA family protein [Alphaproteobacteria bacterium]
MSKSAAAVLAIVAIAAAAIGLYALPSRNAAMGGGGLDRAVARVLAERPELIIGAIQLAETRARAGQEARAREALASNERLLLGHGDDAVVLGNPAGDVTVVEFFDYRCPYCKRVADGVFETIAADGKVRLVMKEWPILGPDSLFASRAALASRKQGKYAEFHRALMAERGALGEQAVLSTAARVGLNVEQLARDMMAPEIEAHLRQNHALARSIGLEGTPAFVVGREIVPGAIDAGALKELIARARQG